MTPTSHILIVEDNDKNRKLFQLITGSMGCQSTLACDGEEGLRKVGEALPDLIILDIQMPRMDGLTLMSKLQENDQTRSIPVIAVTSLAMPGDRERLLAAGFAAYLSKPIDTEEFQQAVRSLLQVDHEHDA